MANYRDPQETIRLRGNILCAAAELFLTQGYAATTVKQIASRAGVSTSNLMYIFKSKDEILALLSGYILERQFRQTEKLLGGVPEDKILFYAAETTLQLHICESSAHMRELYSAAYSLPKSTDIIQQKITGKLEEIFCDHLPHLETKDFYELEIASSGIMRSFMSIPCDMYFTMGRKISRFLETTFLIYRVSDEKIAEAIDFVSQFDFEQEAQCTVASMMTSLKQTVR